MATETLRPVKTEFGMIYPPMEPSVYMSILNELALVHDRFLEGANKDSNNYLYSALVKSTLQILDKGGSTPLRTPGDKESKSDKDDSELEHGGEAGGSKGAKPPCPPSWVLLFPTIDDARDQLAKARRWDPQVQKAVLVDAVSKEHKAHKALMGRPTPVLSDLSCYDPLFAKWQAKWQDTTQAFAMVVAIAEYDRKNYHKCLILNSPPHGKFRVFYLGCPICGQTKKLHLCKVCRKVGYCNAEHFKEHSQYHQMGGCTAHGS